MIGLIGILAAAKRLLGVFLSIKDNGPSIESALGSFKGSENSITPNTWNHVSMSVANGVATFYVNGQNAGGNLGAVPPITNYGAAKLYNVGYLRNTVLNINANSILGANNKTFQDKSPVSSRILTTSAGLIASGVTLGSFSPYSNQEWSAKFSTTNYLSVKAAADQFAFGIEDFTIEFWAYINQSTSDQILIDLRPTASYKAANIYVSSTNKLVYVYGGDSTNISTENFPYKKWVHVALSRKYNSSTMLFLDGKKVIETILDAADVHNFTTNLVIGRNFNNAQPINGYISNLRIVRGSALYNSDFTPTSQSLKILPQKEIKTNSVIFPNTTTAYLSSNNSNYTIGLNDFALEMWIYKTSAGNAQLIDNRPGTASDNLYFYLENEKVIAHDGRSPLFTSKSSITLNTWYHLRFTRDAYGYKLYINGIFEGGSNFSEQSYFSNCTNLVIGNNYTPAAAWSFKGYISNLRLVIGSTIEYPSVSLPTSSLKIMGASAENYIGIFNGTTSYLSAASNNLSAGNGNFTIECFAYFNNTAATTVSATIFDMRAPTTGNGPQQTLIIDTVGLPAGAGRLVYYVNSIRQIVSTVPVTTGNWYHIAIVKNSNTTTLYVDGVSRGSVNDAFTYNPNNLHIGVDRVRTGGFLNGYLSNFRVVTGSALYTSDFTKPSSDLSAVNGTVFLGMKTKNNIDSSIFNTLIASRGNFVIGASNFYENIYNEYSIRSTTVGGISSVFVDPPIALGDTDYTIEFFIFINNAPATNLNILGDLTVGGQTGAFYLSPNCNILQFGGGGAARYTSAPLTKRKWHHIAIVKQYKSLSFYINGKFAGNPSAHGFSTSTSKYKDIGNLNIVPGLDGNIAEFRITKGEALYLTDFTVPSNVLTSEGELKSYHYSGNFTFSSYISATNFSNNAFDFQSSAFTIEFWVYVNAITTSPQVLFDTRNTAAANANVATITLRTDSKIEFFVNGEAKIISDNVLVEKTWYHIAFARDNSNNGRLFINGAPQTTIYSSMPAFINSTNLCIGGETRVLYLLNGYMSNLRVVKGTALYINAFSPSNVPLTNIPNTTLLTLQNNGPLIDNSNNFASNVLIAYNRFKSSIFNPFNFYDNTPQTCLLISARNKNISDFGLFNIPLSGVNNTYYINRNPWETSNPSTVLLTLTSNTHTDASGFIDLLPTNISFSAVDPFGTSGSSGIFNGTSYLSAKSSNTLYVNENDFTIETWFYQTSAAAGTILDTRPFAGTGAGGYLIGIDTANRITIKTIKGTTTLITGPTIDTNKWYHFSISRKMAEKSEYFLNGKYIGNDTDNNDKLESFAPSNIVIGATNAGLTRFVGLISNFRIIKGQSIYNFLDQQLYSLPSSEVTPIKIDPAAYSCYFNGTTTTFASGALNHSEFGYGLSSFTIEMWIKPQSNTLAYLWDQRSANSATRFYIARTATGRIKINANNIDVLSSNVVTPINQWSHIALSRQNNVGMSLYINGVSAGGYNDRTVAWGSDNISIGRSRFENINIYKGLISNIRVIKNESIYSGQNITVPTSPLTKYASYSLNKCSTIFDYSKKRFFSINTSNYNSFNFQTNSFCLEFFLYSFDINRVCTIVDTRDLNNLNGNFLRIEKTAANKIACYVGGTARITSTTNISAGEWYHVVYERRSGSNSTLYINGVNNGTYADSAISYAKINYIYIGSDGNYFDGCMSNFRISNNAIYSGTVTSPTDNFSNSQTTQLLLFQNEMFVDSGTNNITDIFTYPETSYDVSYDINPFYPKNGSKTLFIYPDKNGDDFSGSYNKLTKNNVNIDNDNPFNNPTITPLLFAKKENDYIAYNVNAFNNAGNSIVNPFGATFITSFLSLNGSRYKDASIYNAPSYNISSTQQPIFTNFSPFLNLSPYTSANGGSILFGNSNTKFLIISSEGKVSNFNNSDFTIEFWIYKNTNASSLMMIYDTASGIYANSPGHMRIYLNSTNNIVFLAGGIPLITTTSTLPTFAWNHIAITKKGSSINIYINGVADNSAYNENNPQSVSANYTDSNYFAIGSQLSSLNVNTFTGYITDFHIVSGQCLYKSTFTPPIEPLSSFSNTKLLINANNAGVIDSTGKFNLYAGGGIYISDDVPSISASASTASLSAGSIYFDGNNNSYIYTDVNSEFFNLSAFTAELWVKPTITSSTSAVLFSIRASETDKLVLSIDNNRRVVYRSTNATTISSVVANTSLNLDEWSHIALVRESSPNYKARLYVNGAYMGFTSAAITTTDKLLHIGSDNNNNRFTGYIDDFRIIGEVRESYAAVVELPSREGEIHNNLATPDDPFLEKTSLLINADSNASTDNNSIEDESANFLSVSKHGIIYQGSKSPFSPGFGYNPIKHGGSIYLNGSSDVYIDDPNAAQKRPFDLNNNYTLEAWVYPENSNEFPAIFDTRKKATSAIIGASYNNLNNRFKGYITGVKTSKNISRYNSDFSVEMTPPVTDQYTSLLLNFRKAGIFDSLSKNNIATVGDAVLSYEQKKYGIGSVFFSGNGYLAIPPNNHFLVSTGDFCIEWNMYLTSNFSNYGIFTTVSPDTNTTGHLHITFKNNALCLGTYGGLEINFPTCSGTLNEWMHIAVVRENGVCRAYKNGISQGSIPFTTNVSFQSGAYIGKTYNAPMHGYIDEFRFTLGENRYTIDFIPNLSMSLLYDAGGTGYTIDNTQIILNPPRYPQNNTLDDYLANNKIMVDCVLVGGGGAGGNTTPNNTTDTSLSAFQVKAGGGGGGAVKFLTFEALKQPLIITIGAGGVAGYSVASTKGNNSELNGFISLTALGGGAGGSFYNNNLFFSATSGGNGGGAFWTQRGIFAGNLGAVGEPGIGYSGSNCIESISASGSGGGAGGIPTSEFLFPYKLYGFTGSHGFGASITQAKNAYNNLTFFNPGGEGKNFGSFYFGGGGSGTTAINTAGWINGGSSSYYGLIVLKNLWGGGGLFGSTAYSTAANYILCGGYGVVNTGGGGGGGSFTKNPGSGDFGLTGGSGGSGIAIFKVPLILNDFFQTTGTVDRIQSGDYMFIIFKSSGTLQLV